jgi:hypothetical protein
MRTLTTLVLCATFATSAAAQGTLSSQGFGYPAGGLSTHAEALGGAIAESDPLSPVNPASLSSWGRPGLYLQYDPEFRTVTSPGASSSTLTARFPMIAGALNIGPRLTFGISATTFLDRTFQVTRNGYVFSGADSTLYGEKFTSDGAINDIRGAVAFSPFSNLSIGVGAHVLTGSNHLSITRELADTSTAIFSELSTLSYTGHKVSGGIDYRPLKSLAIGISGDAGGNMTSFRNDTTLSTAKVPKRVGFGATFAGVSGVLLSANAEWHGWSSLNGLGDSDAHAVDGWDYGVGAEVRAPSLFGQEFPVRIGYRKRILPFEADLSEVHETDYSFGIGIPVSRSRSSRIDLSVTRSNRDSAVPDVSEHGWILSAGFFVRP